MKKIYWLAALQFVMGCAIAAYCIFFDVSKYRKLEHDLGNNLLEYCHIIDENKQLINTSAESLFKVTKSLHAVANNCQNLADKIKGLPFTKKVVPTLITLRDNLEKQAQSIDEAQKNFPKTIQALDTTRNNLNNFGNILVKESPVNRICSHIKLVAIMLAAMMIINAAAFIVIAKEKKTNQDQY